MRKLPNVLQATYDLEEARKRLGGTLPRLETAAA